MSKVSDKLIRVLRYKQSVVTRAFFWRILHNSGEADVRLKVGRYKKPKDWRHKDEPESLDPKSELTFDQEEFEALVTFIQENYEPFRQGFKAFIPVDRPFTSETAEQVKNLFDQPDRRKLIEFLASQNVVPDDVLSALEQNRRAAAVREFEAMLAGDRTEHSWQGWFEENSWVLGSDFVRVLDERRIDTKNISDFLMEAYDGFLDVVEIKRPEGDMKFWSSSKDHGNYVPSMDLVKAITQASRYIFEIENEANSVKFLERVGGVRTVKPRGVLIFGRSKGWDREQQEAYRILNDSYHNLTIMSYDHVLQRAKRIAGVNG